MKSILISIKPKYVAKILNGEKTIEIRKTMPKCGLPIDVYIYCTKEKGNNLHKNRNGWFINEMNVIFVDGKPIYENHNGKVVAKFTLNKVEELVTSTTQFIGDTRIFKGVETDKRILKDSCLTYDEIIEYLNIQLCNQLCGYAWHISNLVIFDKPKELSEFKRCTEKTCIYGKCHKYMHCFKSLTKAPQSWCYVEVLL